MTAEFVQADFVTDNKASVDRLFSKFDEIGGDFQVGAVNFSIFSITIKFILPHEL